MFKLHKNNKQGHLLYAECWVSNDEKGIVHTGKVGRKGEIQEIDFQGQFNSPQAFLDYYRAHFEDKGYSESSSHQLTNIVIQYPMKSRHGNKRDNWLKDKVSEYLNEELGWKGIGHVDGFDMGVQSNTMYKYVLNIYYVVFDEEKGIAAIKKCLREYRLDYTRIKIATRPYLSMMDFELKFSANKKNQTFSI